MANKIQIKRSSTNNTVTGLSNGELAYTQVSNTLWIGLPDGSATIAIAGARNPGTLTANQALVANSTSGIDKIIVANLVPTNIYANGASGTAGQVLSSNSTGGSYWSSPTSGVAGSNTQVQYNNNGTLAGSAGITFDYVGNNLSVSNTITAVSQNTGSGYGSAAGGATVNTTIVGVGNTTVNAYINTSILVIGGNPIANSTGANNAFYLGGTLASGYQTTAGLSANVATLAANNASYLGGIAAASYVQNTDSRTLSGNLALSGANVTFSGANLTVTGTNTYITSNTAFNGTVSSFANVVVNGSNLDATSATLRVLNATVSGNLTVSGTLVTLNTQTLVVNDNIIELAENNTTTDVVDSGWFSPAGNSTVTWYSGIARIAASSNSTAGYFKFFTSNTNPNTATTIDTTSNTKTAFLQAYLVPYGTGGAFVANGSNITVTANSTVAVGITANTLSLTTALAGTSGGTGLTSIANNALVYGNSTNGFNTLAIGTDGLVLQASGGAIVYNSLDGGSF